jgi:hypothetical protein
MTFLLIAIVGVLLGFAVGRLWIIPATAVAAAAATALLVSGGNLADSPFLFVALITAGGAALGVVVRRRQVLRTRPE